MGSFAEQLINGVSRMVILRSRSDGSVRLAITPGTVPVSYTHLVIDSLGYFINRTGNFGIFIYGALERLLIPTGLHHLVYTPSVSYTHLAVYKRQGPASKDRSCTDHGSSDPAEEGRRIRQGI